MGNNSGSRKPGYWERHLPKINKMLLDGSSAAAVASHFSVPPSTFRSAMVRLADKGMQVEGFRSNVSAFEKHLPEIKKMRSYGLTGSEISLALKANYNTLKTFMSKMFSKEEARAWEEAKIARRKNANSPQSVAQEMQAADPAIMNDRYKSNSIMSAGHLTSWGAIWGGNPPPYPHELMRGGLY